VPRRASVAIESLISRTRHVKRNVKRWRGGHMVLRWTAAAILEAVKGFRRLKGHKDVRPRTSPRGIAFAAMMIRPWPTQSSSRPTGAVTKPPVPSASGRVLSYAQTRG